MNNVKNLILSEKEYEYLTKGIASGVGIGTIIGAIIGNVTLFFALGGVIGIVSAGIVAIFIHCFKTNSKI